MVKTKIISLFIVATLLFVAGCSKDSFQTESGSDNASRPEDTSKDGYFVATFFPGIGDQLTKSPIYGSTTRIQSLKYLLFRKSDDGVYNYVENSMTEVFSYEPGVFQSYVWPLEIPVKSVELPYGEYKVVFVGNMASNQFSEQNSEILTVGTDRTFESVRINMPQAGPAAFSEEKCNLYYMATADFSNLEPNPQIMLQRVVSRSTFSRELVNTNQAVDDLIQSVVDQVSEGQLTSDVLEGLLTTKLTSVLSPILGITAPVTTIVDRLVNILLGDLVVLLDQSLLDQVTGLLESTLKAGATVEYTNLDVLLNPWSYVNSVDIDMTLPESIDLNRKVCSYRKQVGVNVPVIKEDSGVKVAPHFSYITLNGDFTLGKADVNTDYHLLQPALSALDGNILGGLLINIRTSIAYPQESNLAYSTMYDLLRLKLADDTQNGEQLAVDADSLKSILDVTKITESILGDGILSSLVGLLVNDVAQAVVDALLGSTEDIYKEGGLLHTLDIHLPNLAIGNISAEGRWGNTNVSDGTVIVPNIE